MFRYRTAFVFLLFFTPNPAYSATTEELSKLYSEFDRFTTLPGQGDYEATIEVAQRIREIGVARNDVEIEIQGLTRLVRAEVMFGVWDPKWGQWRDRARSLANSLPSPNRARCEALMVDGYIRAMYLMEIPAGIDQLNEVVVQAQKLDDDRLFARVYYYLSRVLPLDGQPILAQQYRYRSLLFAGRASDRILEYRVRADIAGYQSNGRAVDNDNIRELVTLSRDLGVLVPPVARPVEERVSADEQTVERLRSLLVSTGPRDIPGLRKLRDAASFLCHYHVAQADWDRVRWVLPVARLTAEKLEDAPTLRALAIPAAMLLASEGKADEVTAALAPYSEFAFEHSRSDLPHVYRKIAKLLDESGDPTNSLKWQNSAMKVEVEASGSTNDQMLVAAQAYLANVLEERKLTADIRVQNQALSRSRMLNRVLAIAFPLAFVCLLLWQSSRRYRLAEKVLQAKVDEQTATLRQARDEAEAARQEAVGADKAKTEFLARVNHELRNPLAALVGSCELLLAGVPGPTNQEAGRTIRSCTQNLIDVIDDVLDFTRIESNSLVRNDCNFSLGSLLSTVHDIVTPELYGDVSLRLRQVPVDLDFIRADEAKLRQVLVNLGQNAARHTESGAITIACEVGPTGIGGATALTVRVTDTGGGVADELCDQLFEPYASGSQAAGTGIGLYICRAFVTCMGGEIRFDAQASAGASFEFSIPVSIAERSARTEQAAGELSGVKQILVVDDLVVNREVVARMLQHLRLKTHHAGLWDEVEQLLKSTTIDVVLMDLRMPDVDGYEMLARIRRLDLPSRPVVLAVTGDATQESRAAAMESGFDGFLAKPFTLRTLTKTLSEAQVLA